MKQSLRTRARWKTRTAHWMQENQAACTREDEENLENQGKDRSQGKKQMRKY